MHSNNPIPDGWRAISKTEFVAMLRASRDYTLDIHADRLYYIDRRTKERFAAVLNDGTCWVK
jgi:hypothetical protein